MDEITGPEADSSPAESIAGPGLDDTALDLLALLDLGGPVVLILLAMSVFALAIVLLKSWQFWRLGVGRTRTAEKAVMISSMIGCSGSYCCGGVIVRYQYRVTASLAGWHGGHKRAYPIW